MNNLKKSWITTTLGVLILAYYIYNFIVNGVEINFNNVIGILTGLGFLATKDAGQTHSKNGIVDGDNQIKPKTKF